MTDAERFLLALAGDMLKPEERLILAGFIGDPNTAGTHAWRPKPWKPGNEIVLSERANGYVTVSAFVRSTDGTFRRRQEFFGAGLALMIDDVGTKVQQKDSWPAPSAIVETSPGNFQFWYFLRERCEDIERFDGVIRAFIASELLGNDPGMAGVNRVGRMPGFRNGKEKYKVNGEEFAVKLTSLDANRRYSIDDLLRGFDLKITGSKYAGMRTRLITEDHFFRAKAWAFYYKWLRGHAMLKHTRGPDKSGWIEIHCPWMDTHTNKADTGAAIREPSAENDWYGAFRCHHGHCIEKGWKELTEWVAEIAADEVASVDDPGFDAIANASIESGTYDNGK